MFAVIYRFQLQPHQETGYQKNWRIVASYFLEHCGALGSCLHKGADGLWVAYSRWPDQATRDTAWPKDQEANHSFPLQVRQAIQQMQMIKAENQVLQQYDEICLEVVDDFLLHKR